MKESHGKGPASHPDPESCGFDREVGAEALTGESAGELLSREISLPGVPTSLSEAEGNTRRGVTASPCGTRRGRRPSACTEAPCAGTGRSRVWPETMARTKEGIGPNPRGLEYRVTGSVARETLGADPTSEQERWMTANREG